MLSVIKSLAAGTDVKVKLCVGTVSYGAEKAALMQGEQAAFGDVFVVSLA